MKKVMCLAFLLSGCGILGGPCIDPNVIDEPVSAVTGRHDVYVANDPSLNENQRAVYLNSAALLRQLVEEAKQD